LVTAFFFTYAFYNFKIYDYQKKPSRQEKKANALMKEKNISWESAMEEIKEEEKINIKQKKESEILEGFLKVLDYLRGTSRFYKMFISLFISLSLLCVLGIIYLSQSSGVYHDLVFENKTVGQIIAEGFFKNIRFFIYESLIITLLGYCLKKISNYISMIEIYKELEILLIMDVQRQDKVADEREKAIVSEDFQKKFSEILTKHYDSFIKNKAELKLKTACEMLKSFKEKQIEK
jgi:hypothetical protein